MDVSTKIKDALAAARDRIAEQVWFQQLKSKWEELDPQSRNYLKLGGLVGSVLAVFLFILSSIWGVYRLRSDLQERQNLLKYLQASADEARRLQEVIPSSAASGSDQAGGWAPYFDGLAASAGLDKSNFSVLSDKPLPGDQVKETIFDLSVKRVNIRQLIRFAVALENGQRAVKLRNLSIDTKGDFSGYMDATLSVSAFTLVTNP